MILRHINDLFEKRKRVIYLSNICFQTFWYLLIKWWIILYVLWFLSTCSVDSLASMLIATEKHFALLVILLPVTYLHLDFSSCCTFIDLSISASVSASPSPVDVVILICCRLLLEPFELCFAFFHSAVFALYSAFLWSSKSTV